MSNSDPEDVRAFTQIGNCDWELITKPELEATELLDWDVADTYRQTLTYLGRSEDGAKLHYREFLGGFSRPPLEFDFEHPLADGNIIALKGARIEVIDANPVYLRYRVLSGFSAQ